MHKNLKACMFLLLWSFALTLHSQETVMDPMVEILSSSKIAGACGILDSLIEFQNSTKMDGGDEFVARFWSAEAARLGKTVKELSDLCDKAILIYDAYWNSIENAQP